MRFENHVTCDNSHVSHGNMCATTGIRLYALMAAIGVRRELGVSKGPFQGSLARRA
jgi:hypothetical protein